MQSQENSFHNPVRLVNNRNSFAVPFYAGVAQLVEQLIRNEQAVGSSPFTSSTSEQVTLVPIFLFKKISHLIRCSFFAKRYSCICYECESPKKTFNGC